MVTRPNFVSVPLADGLQWTGGGGFLYQEKIDGCWLGDPLELFGCGLICEQLPRSRFVAHDLVSLFGEYVGDLPTRQRWAELVKLAPAFPANVTLVATGNGGEFLEAVIARGGEGIVAKQLDAPWGADIFRCKRIETHDCIVSEKHPQGKLSLRLAAAGEDRGWCPCSLNQFHRVRPGDTVEVAAYGLTRHGKFREARLTRLRPDKSAA